VIYINIKVINNPLNLLRHSIIMTIIATGIVGIKTYYGSVTLLYISK